MTYQETLDYLYAQLPMFTRIGAAAIKKDLTNTLELCRCLGYPEQTFKSIHIAGTNGKGSTSHMLAAILQTAGYKTGLYTSPHLKDFRERIRVNGEMISEEAVIQFVDSQKNAIKEIEPSFFEVTVAMAFDHFRKEAVDIAVIETGLGGRLDSTNVITPILSVITNIGYDHMNLLGNTLSEIAFEKAGIIKPEIPVIVGERQTEVEHVFVAKAGECKSTLTFASDFKSPYVLKLGVPETASKIVRADDELDLEMDLTGTYQLKNLTTVLATVDELRKQGYHITDEHLKLALKGVQQLTGLSGRWQTLSTNPLVICDTGHNEDGIKEVLKNIRAVSYNGLHMVIGMVKDKDIAKILDLLPKNAFYYFCQPDLERAKPAHELAEEAAIHGLQGVAYRTVSEALDAAKMAYLKGDLIFVGGSTFVVAEVV